MELYNIEQRNASAFNRLNNDSGLSLAQKDEITKYITYCKAKGIKPVRFSKLIIELSRMSKDLGKIFKEATKEELINLVALIQTYKMAEYSIYEYKVVLKRFYKYLEGNDIKYPEKIEWLRIKEPKNHTLPEDLLTEEEVLRMVDCAESLRDKAFIFLLYETGARAGEILGLRIKDITFDNEMGYVLLDGKTGSRKVPIVPSLSALNAWLEVHPDKTNRNAYLWISYYRDPKTNACLPMTYNSARRVMEKVAHKANVDKEKINLHNFRHSSATRMAKNEVGDQQMKMYYGWTSDSKMLGTYISMANRDLKNPIRKMYGLETPKPEDSIIKPIKCPRCDYSNPANRTTCYKCNAPLDMKTKLDVLTKKQNFDDLMSILLSDPDIKKEIIHKIINGNLKDKLDSILI